MSDMENPFLNQTRDLHKAPEVESAVVHTEESRISETMIKDVINRLGNKYGPFLETGIKFNLQSTLEKLDEMIGGLDKVRGKRILDLGCGSTLPKNRSYIEGHDPEELRMGRSFEPWFPRILMELGAEPVGIDIGNLEDELFEHYRADLTKKGSLNFLPDHSFDAINMKLFLDSPTMNLSANGRRHVYGELEHQTLRLLKKDGRRLFWYGPED